MVFAVLHQMFGDVIIVPYLFHAKKIMAINLFFIDLPMIQEWFNNGALTVLTKFSYLSKIVLYTFVNNNFSVIDTDSFTIHIFKNLLGSRYR